MYVPVYVTILRTLTFTAYSTSYSLTYSAYTTTYPVTYYSLTTSSVTQWNNITWTLVTTHLGLFGSWPITTFGVYSDLALVTAGVLGGAAVAIVSLTAIKSTLEKNQSNKKEVEKLIEALMKKLQEGLAAIIRMLDTTANKQNEDLSDD